jgi:hypothetical protein
MTDYESIEQKTVFGWEEVPYAFIQFDVEDLNTKKPLTVWWKWKHENGKWYTFQWDSTTDFPHEKLNIWYSPEEWDEVKEIGTWTVQATWRNPGSGGGMMKTDFTVTPEPLSSVLFVTGGTLLVARVLRKKVKS